MYLGIERFPRIIQGILGWLWIADPFRDEQISHTATSIFPTPSQKWLRYKLNNELKITKSAIIFDPVDQIAQKLAQIVALIFLHKMR